jgi:hypothetical protein
MKKPCKECPHLIHNRHNNMIVAFSEKTGKKHNCHMTEGKKDLWNVKDENLQCYGNLIKSKNRNLKAQQNNPNHMWFFQKISKCFQIAYYNSN